MFKSYKKLINSNKVKQKFFNLKNINILSGHAKQVEKKLWKMEGSVV